MYPFGGIIIAPFVAGYLASIISRIRIARGLRPGYGTLAICIASSVLVVWLITFGEELLKSNNGKVAMWTMLLLTGLPSTALSGIAAAYVISRYNSPAFGSMRTIGGVLLYCGIAVIVGILAGSLIYR